MNRQGPSPHVTFWSTQTLINKNFIWRKSFDQHYKENLSFPGDSVVKNPPAKQETWVQSLGQENPLEKKIATHSSIPAWEIPWTEEPGRLQSLGLQESDMTQ